MVVLKYATYTTRCPFSKTLIKPRNKICLFNQEQFDAYKRNIHKELEAFLLPELIDLIIEQTGYEKLLGRFGHADYAHWTIKYTVCGRKSQKLPRFGNDCESESESESE